MPPTGRGSRFRYKDSDPLPQTVAGMHNLLLQLFDDPLMSRMVHNHHDLDLGGVAQHHHMAPTYDFTPQWTYPRVRKIWGKGGFY